jgi:hypothetical protein
MEKAFSTGTAITASSFAQGAENAEMGPFSCDVKGPASCQGGLSILDFLLRYPQSGCKRVQSPLPPLNLQMEVVYHE